MKKLDLVQHALNELGAATPPEISNFVWETYGVRIEPGLAAVMRATLWHEELLQQYRREAKEAVNRANAG